MNSSGNSTIGYGDSLFNMIPGNGVQNRWRLICSFAKSILIVNVYPKVKFPCIRFPKQSALKNTTNALCVCKIHFNQAWL